ncbi:MULTISPECIES: DUF2017 domain-containing protein [Streptomyces]|uniref:DUF2017 domain-containing protein n=1 Tax=Streptomyces thermoviolaceus subsp. thermoviolaceus TaxID=66860 RepID=A0ABX0YVS8_STRTL|nr:MULTISPECIES: DUF2017 domain-containing protein [Streptomyces]MCM3265535.1 DUF2017 domain-containing protein [Streptomyces thermoviolaceus]NJP16132.1 DUF2017 domain-containing protein [Streptomyces thermoviolaceus subsp. thermoviolaceus]RSR98687.1 DUF2017 domain-containing protein [Streptomyces sp. WAC00469]WTD49058.1 DUF2017 domain-containing protein [Streptomyces thermoviolaceus]GGV73870.1 hypothetical protein GCM10010499_27980 [Streptomyces thermoviolaceus subsp. apingens]
MPGYFEPLPDGGAAVALDTVEISIIRSLAVQLLELIGPGPAEDGDADPLAELFAEGPSEPPSDPVLRRLFPDAYGDPAGTPASAQEAAEQRARSAEFRRYTENDLRAGKRDNALTVVRTLDELASAAGRGPAALKLSPEQSRCWLGALNDLRLALGARLEITDEDEADELYRLPDDDPRKPMVMAYLWLGGLQESLVATLMP